MNEVSLTRYSRIRCSASEVSVSNVFHFALKKNLLNPGALSRNRFKRRKNCPGSMKKNAKSKNKGQI